MGECVKNSYFYIKNSSTHYLINYDKGRKMRLNELSMDDIGIIKKIYAKEPLKSKLLSMGFARGEKVKVLKHTLAKNTFDIDINGVNVALRSEEAKEIEIKKTEN